jgi:hypothetical protein
MRRLALTALVAALGWAAASVAAQSAFAAALCVGPGPGCYSTIQAAVNAAQDGDTISIAPGTYAGGITIDKSLHLLGTAAASTIIKGSGPVVTIGNGSSRPTVSIERVTITGGLNMSVPGQGFAAGGGIEIPPLATDNSIGATVSIADSVITGNRANPVAVVDDKVLCALTPFETCAVAFGGGIDNSGNLTLSNTEITENVAGSTATEGSVATVARGGGIYNHPQGVLTLDRSVVNDNGARVTSSDSYAARGGGILDDGVLTLSNSRVTGNSAELSSSLPGSIFAPDSVAHAVGGGIAIADQEGSATIAASTISGNSTSAANAVSDALVDAGGIDVEGTLVLNNSRVEGNRLRASVAPTSGSNAAALGGGVESGGDTSTVAVNNSIVDGNVAEAQSGSGGAFVLGAGIADDDTVTLHHTEVAGNSGSASGSFGLAFGGGIANSDYDQRPPHLTLVASLLSGNALSGSPGFTLLGGGLFSGNALFLTPIAATVVHTQISGNQPDQCFGC